MTRASDTREAVLLLGVFAAHNLEEIAHLPQDLEALPPWVTEAGPWRDARSFAAATGLLTAAVGAASGAGLRSGGSPAPSCWEVPQRPWRATPPATWGGRSSSAGMPVAWRRRR